MSVALVALWIIFLHSFQLRGFLLRELLLLKQDSLGELFTENVQLVSGCIFSALLAGLLAPALRLLLLVCVVSAHGLGAPAALVILLVKVFLVLLEELADSSDSAHRQSQLRLLQGRLLNVYLPERADPGDGLRQLGDLGHRDTEHLQLTDV
eukprot:CAMPEP_0170471636 /NCGR_PEP_ID=MMETSP0123-20130129/13807_1 /TAXON_ID=182087 /ORGANISM="Favella ehrenbergii, Strain Fehren 1" /LENGTH=151 /DNA_ID=CAMNT_0010739385 /DNA_START=687 /DNA_END=1142 /DNA_ORIENTATION=+